MKLEVQDYLLLGKMFKEILDLLTEIKRKYKTLQIEKLKIVISECGLLF